MVDHRTDRRWMVIISCLFMHILVSCSSDCGNGFNRIRLVYRIYCWAGVYKYHNYRLSSDVDNGLIIHPITGAEYKANTYCSWYIEGNR